MHQSLTAESADHAVGLPAGHARCGDSHVPAHRAVGRHAIAERRLRELHAAGHSRPEIAKRLGVSKDVVAGHVRRLGLAPVPNRNDWPPAKDQRLRDLHAAGHSYAEIGRTLGMTKGAVSGRVWRLKLAVRPVPKALEGCHPPRAAARVLLPRVVRPRVVRPRVPKPAVAKVVQPLPVPVPARMASGVAAAAAAPARDTAPAVFRHACCWPFGDPGTPGFRLCDVPIERAPYCAEHRALAYIPTRRQGEAA
jgi:GcrA cell cycle regulator